MNAISTSHALHPSYRTLVVLAIIFATAAVAAILVLILARPAGSTGSVVHAKVATTAPGPAHESCRPVSRIGTFC